MDSINTTIAANRTMNAQPERRSSLSDNSPERRAALIALIQQTRSLSSLPLSAGDELAIAVSTWGLAVEAIPDRLLGPSWERAVKTHDWSRPFSPMTIDAAYRQLVVEDREQRNREQYQNTRRADGTLACYHCEDTGYTPIATYCPTGNEWYFPVYACHCASTPISQRGPSLVRSHWEKNDRGQWVPTSASESPRCRCGFCRNKGVA